MLSSSILRCQLNICFLSDIYHTYSFTCSFAECAQDKQLITSLLIVALLLAKVEFLQRNFIFQYPWQLPLHCKCQSKKKIHKCFWRNSGIIVKKKKLVPLNVTLGLGSHLSQERGQRLSILELEGKGYRNLSPQASHCPLMDLYLVASQAT